MSLLRVVIADDDELTRGGIRLVVGALPDVDVVAEAANGREAREAVERLKPDVVLMDIRMPVVDGLAALRAITGPTRVIMLTTFGEEQYIDEALAHGAAGFVLKSSAAEELGPALRAAAAGEVFLSPPVTRHAVTRLRGLGSGVSDGAVARLARAELSEREVEVLKLLARGLSNTAISGTLVISESTVKTHVSRILMKLSCENRVQAALLATRAGLLQ
ncbi:DNA-binding NarL/FixJ family response regulator [Catenuloplanes nepalensis]|uniref:DNA-binding NarL/FixJ family response regulator n=1 Tax=Catenuloplanes nepalensis TaxID=587533 RepID=A0ABT9MXL2_9ACTN|nr:response regulator transcription factor [Catenuloplanes nepalensis]MDP9796125.1 DNA-binding NarL/FixJ family response regulator [Catenuloplanes nepalensis]